MWIIKQYKRGISYMKNQNIELRIRMLFFLEYAALLACVVGTLAMLAFTTSMVVLIPNFVLIFMCIVGIYLSHYRRNYKLAAGMIVGGCAYIALPIMFFTAGGSKSGMPIWFLFGVIFTCMMLEGKTRVIMSTISIIIPIVCMLVGYYNPELVIPLKNEETEFMDMLQSFAVVSVIVCICLLIYIYSYDEQRKLLQKRSSELQKIMNTDALTGISNRHAYYADSLQYADTYAENLVLVAMDVNGLKRVNDSEGHAAGDELLKSAAGIMQDAYEKYGKIYRTGGDEFVAILFCENSVSEKLGDILDTVTKYKNEKMGSNISIAAGIVCWNEHKDSNFFGLEKLADKIMYENKSKFYRESGFDRRKR